MPFNIPLRPPVALAPASAPPPKAEAVVGAEAGVPAKFAIRWLYWRATQWLLVALGIQTLAALMPSIVEVVYSQKIYHFVSRSLSIINRIFTFSVGEVFLVALVIWFILWALWYMRRAFRGESRFFDVIKLLLLHMLWSFAVLYFIFLMFWGLNFQRMPIADTWGLERRPARSDELQAIGARIVDGINRNYRDASEGQDWARSSTLPVTRQRLNQALETSFQNTTLLQEASQGGLGIPKSLYFTRMAGYMGYSGIYMPFTGEPTINDTIPPAELPFAMANQKAHQRGFAREDEANFVAYVICTNADDPYVRYSGYLHGVKVLDVIERAGISGLKGSIGPGPSADLDASRQFWATVKNPDISSMSTQLLSAYLRLNRVRSGVANYDEDIPLIIGFYLKNSGRE
ncbi:MAG: DUF3810 domain-containing protein [Acidobacteria bacterium]|nr:DUF3810 domain-containing protein [Acidobacteriota bacterium]